jgi:uncharacterized protein YjiK
MAMKENLISFLIITGVLILVGALWFAYENPALNPRLDNESYKIIRKWEMPEDLDEISGIAYISEDKMACVQDEEGIIYIYNLTTDLVEKKVNFAKSGDYEGIAIVDSTAYVLESNGRLHQVERFMDSTFTTSEIKTFFTGKNNMESLTFDSEKDRLLLAVKNKDPHSEAYKGIYSFDLATENVVKTPVFKIPMDDPILNYKETRTFKGNSDGFYPSEIAIHPKNGNVYILEGKNPRLLIMDTSGKLIKLHKLNKKSFPQPEGMTFAPDGTLYISNEGKKGMANIFEVELKD